MAVKPTLMITGSGGANTTANTITFNFSAAIKDDHISHLTNIPTANVDIGNWDVSKVTTGCGMKHIRHIRHLTNIPTTNVLVKGCCTKKHMTHISHLTNIPTANVLTLKMGRLP
jgi:hypothetical protein